MRKQTHLSYYNFTHFLFFFFLIFVYLLGICTSETQNVNLNRLQQQQQHKAIDLPESIPDLHDKGNLLAEMEWHLGSDDVSAEEANAKHILSNTARQTPGGRMFGMRDFVNNNNNNNFVRPDSTNGRKENSNSDVDDEYSSTSNDRFGAKLVNVYSRELDPNDQSVKPLLKQYKHYLSTNGDYVERLKRLFTDMDENGDGAIDDKELDNSIARGHLTSVGARAIKTWDINYSRHVSWEEFSLGPFMLLLLETNKELLDDFMQQRSGYADKCAKYYLSMMSAYERENPAAFGLVEESSTMRVHDRAQSQSRSKRQIFSKMMGGLKSMFGFGKGKEIEHDPRPKSVYGIPSFIDEKCVFCQYVVQRVEHEMQRKVVEDFTAFDNIPKRSEQAPNPNSWEAIKSRSRGRRDSMYLHDKKKERSPTRVMKQMTETIMRSVCGDNTPSLYKKACKQIWSKRGQLAYGIVRKRSAAYNCQLSKICISGSYFYFDTVVHAPVKSERLNGLRGLCGLLGGANERKVGVSKTMCFLQGMGRSVGVLS